MPRYFYYDKSNLEVKTLIQIQGTDKILIFGSYMRKLVTKDFDLRIEAANPKIITNAFILQILDNGTNDNFKLLDYC